SPSRSPAGSVHVEGQARPSGPRRRNRNPQPACRRLSAHRFGPGWTASGCRSTHDRRSPYRDRQGQNIGKRPGLYRGPCPGHAVFSVVPSGRLTAWIHGVDEDRESLGVVDGPGFHHPRRRSGLSFAVSAAPGRSSSRSRNGRCQHRPGAVRFSRHGTGSTLMFISYRFVLLALVGFLPMVWWPSWGTVFLLLGVLVLVLLVDVGAAPSPRSVAIRRSDNKQVRLD